MLDHGEDWQYANYLDEILFTLKLPCPATVLGEPVTVTKLAFNGNLRRGIIATVRKPKGGISTIAAAEITLDPSVPRCHAFDRYRRWIGVSVKEPKTTLVTPAEDLPVGTQVTFVALSPQRDHVLCRLLGASETFPFRGKDNWQLQPAELVHATLTKPWRPTGGRAMWARMDKREFNVPALNLAPLKLLDEHPWDPSTPSAIKVGRCLSYEMEVVTPRWNPADPSTDPIELAVELNAGYDFEGARQVLYGLLVQDLRCLDAFAHLGAFEFDRNITRNEHFDIGYQIGALSLGEDFNGVLPWARLGNRPFLRCMHGHGLTLWRRKNFEEAHAVLQSLLRLNPMDNQGVRFILDDIKAHKTWEDSQRDNP